MIVKRKRWNGIFVKNYCKCQIGNCPPSRPRDFARPPPCTVSRRTTVSPAFSTVTGHTAVTVIRVKLAWGINHAVVSPSFWAWQFWFLVVWGRTGARPMSSLIWPPRGLGTCVIKIANFCAFIWSDVCIWFVAEFSQVEGAGVLIRSSEIMGGMQ